MDLNDSVVNLKSVMEMLHEFNKVFEITGQNYNPISFQKYDYSDQIALHSLQLSLLTWIMNWLLFIFWNEFSLSMFIECYKKGIVKILKSKQRKLQLFRVYCIID